MEFNKCLLCGKETTTRCGKCGSPYCSRECIAQDWPKHKIDCAENKIRNASENERKYVFETIKLVIHSDIKDYYAAHPYEHLKKKVWLIHGDTMQAEGPLNDDPVEKLYESTGYDKRYIQSIYDSMGINNIIVGYINIAEDIYTVSNVEIAPDEDEKIINILKKFYKKHNIELNRRLWKITCFNGRFLVDGPINHTHDSVKEFCPVDISSFNEFLKKNEIIISIKGNGHNRITVVDIIN